MARHYLERVLRRIGGPGNRAVNLGRRLMPNLDKLPGYVVFVSPGKSLRWAMAAPMEPRPLSGPDLPAVERHVGPALAGLRDHLARPRHRA